MTGRFALYCRGAGALLLTFGTAWSQATAEEPQFAWKSVFQLSPPARLDAITDLGGGKVLVGSRDSQVGGYIAASDDFGQTWTEYGRVIDGNILNLLALDSRTVLASTVEGEIWKSVDEGKSWRKTQKLTDARLYSMTVTDKGTVLTATTENGGRVFRSTDAGETWSQARPGATSPKGLYRFQRVQDGVLVNGWAGHLYKSFDDGLSWTDLGQISTDPLYPIEALPTGVVLLGDEKGKIFRSTDNGLTWNTVTDIKHPLDDFVWVQDELVYLSTYGGTKHLFVSQDAGATWSDNGPTPEGDILDHVIRLRDAPTPVAVGGTTEGRILRLTVDPQLNK